MTKYALQLSDAEISRYRRMAEVARADEIELWTAAGIVPGARVADLGCGPGASLVVMADVVGPTGAVVGIDGDPAAVEIAGQLIEASGHAHASAQVGDAAATGLEPGSFDVAVFRHVLAHNGPTEQALVDHAASLVRPGGCVYIVDITSALALMRDEPPVVREMNERYREFHAKRGNDLSPGMRLDVLLTAAGLTVDRYDGQVIIFQPPPGMRPPMWAARDAMVAAGVIDDADVARWAAFFEEADKLPKLPMLFIPTMRVVGRKPE